MTQGHLWDAVHPYYGTTGCYYVSSVLGHQSPGRGWDGRVCHSAYETWEAFKNGDMIPFTPKELAQRASYGIEEDPPEQIERQLAMFGKEALHSMDMDLNLLYRWDWCAELDDNEVPTGRASLDLFFMGQRKARPFSATILSVTRDDEPEIRAWLWTRWCHLLRLWSPISGWPVEPRDELSPDNDEAEVPLRPELHQALEHVACEMADAARQL